MIVTILYEFLGSGSAYLWEHRQSRGWSGCSDAGKWEKKSDGRCKNNARHIGTFESDCRKCVSQVMVCGDRVGWREEARRVIIYTTDQVQWWWSPTSSSSYNWPVGPSSDAQVLSQVASNYFVFQSFHSAGDGKLGGLTLPNDGQCHLNTTGFYDWSTVQVFWTTMSDVNQHLGWSYSHKRTFPRNVEDLWLSWRLSLTTSGLPQPRSHQPRCQRAQCEPCVGCDRGAPQPLQEAHSDDLHQCCWTDILRFQQCRWAGADFNFSSFHLFWQGEGDVPEDYNKHQDRRQLHILSLCSLYQRLQW